MVATQLVFLFLIETDPDDPYQKLELRVDLPGGDHRQMPLNIGGFQDGQADKVRWSLKYPFLFQNPILRHHGRAHRRTCWAMGRIPFFELPETPAQLEVARASLPGSTLVPEMFS